MYAVESVGSARAHECAGSRYPFLTQKERDVETGLDYFLARYYSAVQGRFTSPDPFGGSGTVFVPQSWNKYTYCLNRPFVFTDPSGQIWLTTNNESFIWVEDAEYENNRKKYEGYSIANGAVTKYQSSTDCPQCANIPKGVWIELQADGTVKQVANPTTSIYAGEDEINEAYALLGSMRESNPVKGPPNGSSEVFYDDGRIRQRRDYDHLGRPMVDTDYHDGEEAGNPHVHWWDWTKNQNGERGKAQPVPEGWWRGLYDDGTPAYNPRAVNPFTTIPVVPLGGMRFGAPVRGMAPLRPMVPLRPILMY